jgi:hypothetical protein
MGTWEKTLWMESSDSLKSTNKNRFGGFLGGEHGKR